MGSSVIQIGISTIGHDMVKGLLSKKLKKKLRTRPYYKPTENMAEKPDVPHSIRERSAGANIRIEIDHWESDTVRGSGNSGCIAIHANRKIRYRRAIKLNYRKTETVMRV